MRYFCTLFDKAYLARGLALYESLMKHSSQPFLLYVLAMDRETEITLDALQLRHLEIIPLDVFETQKRMTGIRAFRTWTEFCWTCASQLCEDLLMFKVPEVTYVDSDCYFYGNPDAITEEIGARSIGITPHRFPDNDQKPRLLRNGAYNVGVVHFKNTEAGRACLSKWAADVRDWCFYRNEDGKFGDQGYLDFFERDFGDEVCSIQAIGINAGPWNLMSYEVSERDGIVYLNDSRLTCYHFHEYEHGSRLTNYPLRRIDKELIYAPYADHISSALERISQAASVLQNVSLAK